MNFPIENNRIHLLSPLLANQIAAGEVIERPASVLKELIENAIDAGADEIEIELDKGGLQLIKISDNGHGIHVDDLFLALKRHGTSKIKDEDDLVGIASLGFRGEALASIASIAKVVLASRYKDCELAYQICCEGDVIQNEPIPCALLNGTSITVSDLFFNVPARRAFLRSEKTEFQHIQTLLGRLALSHFNIGFSLTHNGKLIWKLPRALSTAAKELRVQKLFSKNFMQDAYHLEVEHGDFKLFGWLTHPDSDKAFPTYQQLYVNKRMVRDKTLIHATKQAYQSLSQNNNAPGFLLFLELNPKNVDVNVHPTKHEVRFRNQRLIHDFVVQAVKQTFSNLDTHVNPLSLFEKQSINVLPQHNPASDFEIKQTHAFYSSSSRDREPDFHSKNPVESIKYEEKFENNTNTIKPIEDKTSFIISSFQFILQQNQLIVINLAKLVELVITASLESTSIQTLPLLFPIF